jgi:type IV pilus assembly PilX-like protein
MMRDRDEPRAGARREEGSAYLIVLLVLVVLTILGLSLVLITNSEMEIGANERSIQRVFYEADSGVAIGTARVLVANEHRGVTMDLDEPGAPFGYDPGSALTFKSRIELAPVVPLTDAPCNLCEINNAGTYNERAYKRINNIVTSKATRITKDDATTLSQKVLSSVIEVQPWKSSPEDYAAIVDPAELAKIKF